MSKHYSANLLRMLRNQIPIDLVMTVGKCSFVDAVQLRKNSIDQ